MPAELSVRLMPGVPAGKELSRSRLDSKNWNLLMSKPTELPDTEPPDPTPESLLPPDRLGKAAVIDSLRLRNLSPSMPAE